MKGCIGDPTSTLDKDEFALGTNLILKVNFVRLS